MAGKTGADIFGVLLHRLCKTLVRYDAKLRGLIAAAVIAAVISSDEATAANLFLDGLNALCSVFERLAEYNSPF